ncbi:hypothetical protein GAYE_PCTG14G0557 [Galdieria yellowstonensis]|uniref:ACT domain-containing protein n=1 Tax=Galdieria yellowstonensis TaxID=3028027 RepID=A0AAV9I4W8_9RHOD|nr:hypothetical protein GAYE_PCTG14G0557 [Galdieria yellowstonensis]
MVVENGKKRMAFTFVVTGHWKQKSTKSSGSGFRVGKEMCRISNTFPFRLGGWKNAQIARQSSELKWYRTLSSISKEKSSTETDELLKETEMKVDHETSSQWSTLSLNGKDGIHLFPELVILLEDRNYNIEHLVLRSENGWVSCNMELSKNGAKLSAEETQQLQKDFQELSRKQSEQVQRAFPSHTKSASDPELPYIDYRDRFVNYESGVAFYTDNHATPTHTTLTAIVPNNPSYLVPFMKRLSEMPLHIIFVSLSTYNREGKTRHDVYHVVTKEGEQLDAAQCDALVEVMTSLFQGETNSSQDSIA